MNFDEQSFKRALYSTGTDKYQLMWHIKNVLDFDSIIKLLEKYRTNQLIKKLTQATAFPQTFLEIRSGRYVPGTRNLAGELGWTVFAIIENASVINQFADLKVEYEKRFMLNDFIAANKILVEISKISKSIWQIENDFLIREYENGTESNWSALSDFIKIGAEPLVLFFAENYSKRSEQKMSYFRFKSLFANQLEDVVSGEELKEYLCFRLDYPAFTGYTEFSFMLAMESLSAIIDRFILMRELSVEIIMSKDESQLKILKKAVQKLQPILTNEVFSLLSNFLSNRNIVPVNKSITDAVMEIAHCYTIGNFSICRKAIPQLLTDYPTCIELFELYVKSFIEDECDFEKTNVSPIIDNILENLYEVFKRSDRFNEASEDLYKIILSFSTTSWAKQLLTLVSEQTMSRPNAGAYKLFFVLFSRINNPRILNLLDRKSDSYRLNQEFFDSFLSSNKAYLVNKWINNNEISSIRKDSEIPEKKKILYEGRAYFKAGNYERAAEHFQAALNFDKITIIGYVEVVDQLFKCLLNLGKLTEAIELFVDNFIKNESITVSLDKETLLQELEKSKLRNVRPSIDLPIFYKLASANSYDQFVAYDTFISTFGYSKPSELLNAENDFEKSKLILFFKEVCTSEILHHSIYFDGSVDVVNERLILLRSLLSFDKENESGYIKEITELTQEAAIKRAIHEVNRGRITVNVQQLKAIESANVKESFQRYQELTTYSQNKDLVGIDSSSELVSKYLEYLNEGGKAGIHSQIKDPSFISFKLIFLELRDKYLLSKEYGLDGYLSTRIRHGTLQNHIRSVFESLNLISQKDRDNNYLDLKYWNENLPVTLTNKKSDIQNAIRKFSQKIDNYTEFIIKELIQVYTEKHTSKINGLFNYSFTQEFLWVLYNYVKDKIKDYDRFLDYSFREITAVTEINLEKIRDAFNGVINNFYLAIIDEFHQDVKEIVFTSSFVDLTTSIMKSRTNIQAELKNISEWFYLSNPENDLILDLSTTARTSIEITNSIYPYFQLNPVVHSNTDLPFFGSIHLIYIYRILLDNIIIHSGVGSDELSLYINADLLNNELLRISISHNISQSLDMDALNKKLQEVKDKWKLQDADMQRFNTEGGSGFDKIRRILIYDLGANKISFDYLIEDNRLTILIDVKIKTAEI